MKIFNPVAIGKLESQPSLGGGKEEVVVHTHQNLAVLNGLSIDEHGVLQFEGKPVDTVGQEFVNAAILEQFSVVDNKLYFAGSPVDTVGSVFSNDAVLRMFSQSEEGTLLFNGLPIEGGSGASLPNAEDLARLAVNADGQLTLDGAVVGGSGGAVTLSVTKLGSGTALLKGIVGSDLQTRSLVAGSNVTLDVSGDEIKINASLNGDVSASSTFTKSDDFTRSAQVISLSYATKLRAVEPSISDSGLVFQATLCDDTNSAINGVALSSKGTAPTIVETSQFRNERALKCNGGCLVVPEGTTASVTAPSTWFSGTKDWCIELEFARDTSKLGTTQNLASNYTDSYANASLWIGIGTDNRPYIGIGYGTTVSQIVSVISSVAITDSNKHHLAIVRQGSTYTLYIDGVSRGTATSAASNNAPAYGFYLGSSVISGSSSTSFYGYLRNVRVWNFAKYTSGFTVPAVAYPTSGDSYLTMAGKLLSASSWKQINSLSVVSTETATAYLKWLMVDSTGYYVWNSTTKVWVASDLANIASAGMTTAEVKACMSNLAWNYRSDMIGFAVAFISTDGTSAPSLTSATIAAVQSADKTAGHSIESATQTLAQRTVLKFLGMDVSDDGSKTVISGYTDSSKLTHKGVALDLQVDDLLLAKGKVGGKGVDLSSGLVDGSVLAYNLSADKFKPAALAIGASGNGLFRTQPFTLSPGEEKTVAHQLVLDGRAVYQADQVVAGASSMTLNRMNSEADVSTTDAAVDRILARSVAKLQTSHGSASMTTLPDMPVASAGSCSYSVDDYIYWMPMVAANWGVQTAIYKAHISNPSAWTLTPDTISLQWPVASKVFRYNNVLFMWSGGNFYTASAATPTKWTVQAKHASAPPYNSPGGAFLVGSKFYVVGMYNYTNGLYMNNIYMIDLAQGMDSAWTIEAKKFPINIGRGTCYQYEDYLYIIGGESTLDTVFSNAVYRAHISDPTSWTRIGSYPAACSATGQAVVKNGKVFVVGGHQQYAALSSVYMADASNPVTWTALTSMPATRFFAGIIDLWDGFIVAGGMQGTSVSTAYATAYKYTLTPSISQTVGTVQFNAVNLSLVQKVDSCTLIANIPVGTSVKSAFSIDGIWYSHDGSAVAERQDRASALAVASAITTTVANEYPVPGLTDMAVNKSELVVAVQLVGTVSATPEVYAIMYRLKARDMYSPLLIAAYGSSFGDLGLAHVQGDYSSTNVKNKTSSEMTVVLKVYDGAL